MAAPRHSTAGLALLMGLVLSVPAEAADPAPDSASRAGQAAAGPAETVAFGEPREISVGDEPTRLYVQFAEVEVPQERDDGSVVTRRIWTRAYGLERTTDLIPGPTFRFQPGDFLQITLDNVMDVEANRELFEFDRSVDPIFDTDEVAHHVRHEMNIPHNPNNTNLHTHGLHVDPSHDDVTLVIIPEGDDKLSYDPSLWPYIREQIWPYQYRIPKIHLPGTHWYHAHKHGSTSIHVENGMAGTLIIDPPDGMPDVVPGLEPADDKVMVIQEIVNYGMQQGVGRSLTHLKNPGDLSPDLTDEDIDSQGADIPSGETPTSFPATTSALITVNGRAQPTLALAPGQLQRWRLVNAAANHRSFSYIWAGRLVTTHHVTKRLQTAKGAPSNAPVDVTQLVYEPVPLHLVALDGITLSKRVETTAFVPLFMGPGNRADVLFVADQPGSYALYKNFPAFDPGASSTAPQTEVVILGPDGRPRATPAQQDQINNPYLLRQSNPSEANFDGLEVPWVYRDTTTGKPQQINASGQGDTVVTPLLSLRPVTRAGGTFLDLTFPVRFEGVGWQPVDFHDAGGGNADKQLLVRVDVSGQPVDGPKLPSDAHLASISPTGTLAAPAYVSEITPDDVLQSRTALFDLSGVSIVVRPKNAPQKGQAVRQFTLNGRQFDLEDSIGNPHAVELINDEPDVPASVSHGSQDLTVNCIEHHGLWINQHWVNPGYYRPLEKITFEPSPGEAFTGWTYSGDVDSQPSGGLTCVPAAGTPDLTYADVTGIDQVAVVNPRHEDATTIEGIPGLPVATTAEEWILINNSPIGHPFHIHINPFFITEIGQLSYEAFEGSEECGGRSQRRARARQRVLERRRGAAKETAGDPDPHPHEGWVIRTVGKPGETREDACSIPKPTTATTLRGDSTMGWVIDNWWDTIVIPPHGYVKMRYWMNVPQQTGDGSKVYDNVNRAGDWVYHCHILRHEDRGMMMLVGTQPRVERSNDDG